MFILICFVFFKLQKITLISIAKLNNALIQILYTTKNHLWFLVQKCTLSVNTLFSNYYSQWRLKEADKFLLPKNKSATSNYEIAELFIASC